MAAPEPPFTLPKRVSQPLWFGFTMPLLLGALWYRSSDISQPVMIAFAVFVVWMWPGNFRPTYLIADGFRVRWRTREIPFAQIVSVKTHWWNNACIATLRDNTKVTLAFGGVHGLIRKQTLRWIRAQIAADAFE